MGSKYILAIRNNVLTNALLLEYMASTFLSTLLGIPDYKKSKTLGNHSSSISFSQKINLLIEIGALDKEDITKYQLFMEVRNQMVHNIDAKTYENCFDIKSLKEKEKKLLKQYPPKSSLSREEKLQFAIGELSKDILKITVDIADKIKDKYYAEIEKDYLKFSHSAFESAIELVTKRFDKSFDKEINRSDTVNTKRLKNLGTGIGKLIYGNWKKRMDTYSFQEKREELKKEGKVNK